MSYPSLKTPLSSGAVRYRQTSDIKDASRLPDTVILDAKQELDAFVENLQDFEFTMDELFNEILMYLSDKSAALEGMQSFVQEILIIHSRENGYDNGQSLAEAAYALAQALYKKFIAYGLYTPEGVMPYELVSWIDVNTPVLQRFREKPTLQGGALRGQT